MVGCKAEDKVFFMIVRSSFVTNLRSKLIAYLPAICEADF